MYNIRMSTKEYDLFVIGAGSGGVRGARWAAARGAKVGICEMGKFGGTCVLRGCIPKKFMVYASRFPGEVKAMEGMGWSAQIQFDWTTFRENRRLELDRLSALYVNILEKHKVDMYQGMGKFLDPHTLQVGKETIKAKNFIIATGGRPWKPEIEGGELTINSNQFFQLSKRPERVLVTGGGFVGVELGQILLGLGSQVEIVIRRPTILRGFDVECTEFLQEQIIQKGMSIRKNQTADKVEKVGDELKVHFSNGETKLFDQVLCATGRVPLTENIGLEEIGLMTDKNRAIIVNQDYQTNLSHIYAVGDVTNHVNLTPVAISEAMIVTENLFGQKVTQKLDYRLIPKAIFATPEMSFVGLTEEEAIEQYGQTIDVYTSNFRPLKYSLSDYHERTFMKMIVDQKTQKVLGCHMVGTYASEIVQGLAIALEAGATKEQFDRTMGIHPTSAEEFTTLRTPRAPKA
jgi:glutathione reductase (NADPH)